MSDQATDTARVVVPFQFLQGKPDQNVQTFTDFLERRDGGSVHPSLLSDVPDDDDGSLSNDNAFSDEIE